MSINRGQILKDRVELSGLNKEFVSKMAGISKRTLYNWFEVPNLSVDKMKLIGKVIHWDFDIDLYPSKNNQSEGVSEPESEYGVQWKAKYYELLETHNKLLRDMSYLNRDLNTTLITSLKSIKDAILQGKTA